MGDLIVAHVALGTLQAERSVVLALLMGLGLVWVLALHLLPSRRERPLDSQGERVAVFRYDGRISVLSNVCPHQKGPLGEGQILDGCVTCPWHGFQYAPDTGASPAPFEEKVPTFRVRVEGNRVLVHPRPNPPGTQVEPARCRETQSRSAFELYVGYQSATRPRTSSPWSARRCLTASERALCWSSSW